MLHLPKENVLHSTSLSCIACVAHCLALSQQDHELHHAAEQVTSISFSEHHALSAPEAAARQHRLARTSSTAEPIPPDSAAEPNGAGARAVPLSPFENGDDVCSMPSTSSSTAERLCVIEAEVLNRTEFTLQASHP